MSRLAIPARDDVPEASKPILDAVNKQLGVVPNMFRLIAAQPGRAAGLRRQQRRAAKTLDVKTRERIALAVAQVERLRLLPVGAQLSRPEPGEDQPGGDRAQPQGRIRRREGERRRALRGQGRARARARHRRRHRGCPRRRLHRRPDRRDRRRRRREHLHQPAQRGRGDRHRLPGRSRRATPPERRAPLAARGRQPGPFARRRSAHVLRIPRYRRDAERPRRAGGDGQRSHLGGFQRPSRVRRFTANEAAFIAERDSFYMATVSETGWPYVQHRGGPRGFLKVVDDKTLGLRRLSRQSAVHQRRQPRGRRSRRADS